MKQDPLRRELFWVTRPYVRNPDTPVGQAALRLSRGLGYPRWEADLDLVLAEVWRVSPFGYYVSPLSAQGAAIHITNMLQERKRA